MSRPWVLLVLQAQARVGVFHGWCGVVPALVEGSVDTCACGGVRLPSRLV